MPIYDFACPKGHRWEEIRPIPERDDPTDCPECGEIGHRVVFVQGKAPHVMWFPDTTKSPFREKLRHH